MIESLQPQTNSVLSYFLHQLLLVIHSYLIQYTNLIHTYVSYQQLFNIEPIMELGTHLQKTMERGNQARPPAGHLKLAITRTVICFHFSKFQG
ncbi:hypothetical protein Hanom_Chr04g00340001 [Helianthus anomalus]